MSHRNPAPLTTRQAAALIRSAGRELGYGLLAVRAELQEWSARACTIPDAELRAAVLQGMVEGRPLVDGAALFWTLPRRRSRELLRTLVALQTLLNFLDIVLERDALVLGQPRHWTWLVGYALDANGPPLPIDIIRNELGEDGGFFEALVVACRCGCQRLPSYAAAREILLREARRSTSFEIEHEPNAQDRRAKIGRWACVEFPEQIALASWELAGGASSLLSAMAVLGMAADPGVPADRMYHAADAYVWVGSSGALMDSYADVDADQTDGSHNWLDYYDSIDHAVQRGADLLGRTLERVRTLPDGERHMVIVSSMAALALSSDAARRPQRRAATAGLARSGGTLTRVLMPILRTWRIAYGRRDG
jgi:hypothetical protein